TEVKQWAAGKVPSSPRGSRDTVRVFIMAGQSNAGGYGSLEHLKLLLDDPKTRPTYDHLRDGDDWVKRKDVWVKTKKKKGPLTVGFGDRGNFFGPELQLGHMAGDRFDNPILIIKFTHGPGDLAVKYRPPSAGIGSYETKNRETGENEPRPPEDYGKVYREMIQFVHETLADLKDTIPEYRGAGVELCGFIWFQAWNDVINGKYTEEYASNLANLVRDVRKDLGVPRLPFIIGEFGQGGTGEHLSSKHKRFREIQKSVADLPEFSGTVKYAETGRYMVRKDEGKHYVPSFLYGGRADTFFRIGQSFGEAALSMTPQRPVNHTQRVEQARARVKSLYRF
ncbi:MAG: sialate O-acetylesterase, partial [Verrucomicrobiota bacterium]